MQPPTRYRVILRDAHAHLFEVSCTVVDPDPAGQRFRLPTWIPGSYLIREFARQFVRVRAEVNGAAVPIVKEAKDLWRASPCAGPLCVVADVYAFDLSVRTAYLDALRGYFNGPSVFLCPEGRADAPCEVELVAPEAASCRSWRIATTMPRLNAAPWGFGTYRADNYDALIDHPVEMADFVSTSFEAGGARHDVAITGKVHVDLDRLSTDLARICQWQADLFGGGPNSRAPFDRYLFQVAAVGDGYGGLEHRTSTSLCCKRDELPAPGAPGVSSDYRRFLGLASHEYFHAWNVKRIKPAAFVPYDLTRESYTRQLWAFEGITSYYDDLALVRSGVIDAKSYLELVGQNVTTVLRGPGRKVQSVADSSFDAWIKFYRRDENSPNAIVSYYVKGSLVALALDLTLRTLRSSLDDVMRSLWKRYGETGIGVPENGIEELAIELAGAHVTEFFARYVAGTDDPPLAALLAPFGVTYRVRPAGGESDRGGKRGREASDDEPRPGWLGASLAGGAQPVLQHVFSGGPAEQAGLAAGDSIVAMDGLRMSVAAIEKLLRRRRPGESIAVHAFRRDELINTELTLMAAPDDTCWLALNATIDDAARARRLAWLGRDA
jgi:predicted metalloprotease with PDZ domain